MKLLIDNQLPTALAAFFTENGIESHHVRDFDLGAATDAEIWRFAKTNSFGNVRKPALIGVFSTVLQELRNGLATGTSVIEIK